MSQEFEKVVLEKLNNIDKKLDEHTDILNEHTGILNEHTEVLNEHTGILNEHTEQFKNVLKDIYEINNKLIKCVERMEDIEEVVKYNTQTIKEYNKQNTKKIDVLLKVYEQLNVKVKANDCLISNLKSKDFQNDIRISALEDQIKDISITA